VKTGSLTQLKQTMEVKAKAKRSFTRQVFKAKHAVLNAVTRDTPTLTHRDFTIDDWGRKIHHQQEESKGMKKRNDNFWFVFFL